MQISLSSAQPKAWSGTVLALGIAEGDPNGLIPAMEERFSISLSDWLEQRKFQGKNGESASLQLLNPDCASLVLVGMGPLEALDVNSFRQAGAAEGIGKGAEQFKPLGLDAGVGFAAKTLIAEESKPDRLRCHGHRFCRVNSIPRQ